MRPAALDIRNLTELRIVDRLTVAALSSSNGISFDKSAIGSIVVKSVFVRILTEEPRTYSSRKTP